MRQHRLPPGGRHVPHDRDIADRDRFLRVNPRYGIALAVTANRDLFAQLLQQAGYATDPNYATKLIDLMHTYNLYQY